MTTEQARRANAILRHALVDDGMADALDALYVATITARQQHVEPEITAAAAEHEVNMLRAELVREIGA